MRNPYAKALSHSLFRQRTVKAVKGKGTYRRKHKHHKKPQLDS